MKTDDIDLKQEFALLAGLFNKKEPEIHPIKPMIQTALRSYSGPMIRRSLNMFTPGPGRKVFR